MTEETVPVDAYGMPQPFPSFYINPTTGGWEPPVPHPGHFNPYGQDSYTWDEPSLSWKKVD